MSEAYACPSVVDYTVDPERSLPLPKEAWRMHIDANGALAVRNWFAPALIYGRSYYEASDLPNEKITAADLERHGITIDTIEGRAVFKKIA